MTFKHFLRLLVFSLSAQSFKRRHEKQKKGISTESQEKEQSIISSQEIPSTPEEKPSTSYQEKQSSEDNEQREGDHEPRKGERKGRSTLAKVFV